MPSGCGVAIGIVLTLFVVFGAGCGMMIAALNGIGDFSSEPREHLRAIPISQKACPYVRVMHRAANDFQRVNPIARFRAGSLAELSSSKEWPSRRARIRHRLDLLEFSVAASRSQFPRPIQRRFDVVLTSIRQSRPLVTQSESGADLMFDAWEVFSTGQTAFGEASDLVGNACVVHLAANRPWVLATHKPTR